MSYKIYCDVCSKAIKGDADRLRRIKGKVMIEVMVRYENTWNAGHVCESCLLDVIKTGRPAKENESWIDDEIRARRKSAKAA